MGYRQHALRLKDQAGADGTIAAFHGRFEIFFQVCGGFSYPRNPKVHRALFWAESLKDEELSNVFGNLSPSSLNADIILFSITMLSPCIANKNHGASTQFNEALNLSFKYELSSLAISSIMQKIITGTFIKNFIKSFNKMT